MHRAACRLERRFGTYVSCEDATAVLGFRSPKEFQAWARRFNVGLLNGEQNNPVVSPYSLATYLVKLAGRCKGGTM